LKHYIYMKNSIEMIKPLMWFSLSLNLHNTPSYSVSHFPPLSLFHHLTMEHPTTDYRQFFIEDTDFYNRIVLNFLLPQSLWVPLPRFFQTWLRNYIGGVLLYFISGFLWCFYIYYWKRNVYLPKGLFFISFFWFSFVF
jgi:hypothetical protein